MKAKCLHGFKRKWHKFREEQNKMIAAKYKGMTSALGILHSVGGRESTLEKCHSVLGLMLYSSGGIHLWPVLQKEFRAGWSDSLTILSKDLSYDSIWSHRNYNMIECRKKISVFFYNIYKKRQSLQFHLKFSSGII